MSKFAKVGVVAVLVVAIGAMIGMKVAALSSQAADEGTEAPKAAAKPAALPKMVDLGAKKCIPCQKMAPILEELTKEYAWKFDIEFIDVSIRANHRKAMQYRIRLIPTQVFLDAEGKELARHEGFLGKADILAKWKALGYDFSTARAAKVERWEPAEADTRARAAVCYMCDGDIAAKTAVTVRTEKGDVRLCGPHCYFILYSCLTEEKTGFETKVSVTDWSTGKSVPAVGAAYLRGVDEKTGRPWIWAFADRATAETQRGIAGGSIVSFAILREAELSSRCGFCDRACYPQDAARVMAAGVHTWGCCSHCALGVAARIGANIEVRQRDRLTGEMIVVKTLDGSVASMAPKTAVAWFGMRKKADGSWGSAGCFHQGFFTSAEILSKWLKANPREMGKMITIQQALADKMKLTPRQIAKACKIGQCAPR